MMNMEGIYLMKCEWCGKDYPEELESGELYYHTWLYGKEHHVICDDCYNHLKPIRSQSNHSK